jgi:hypothetical protein
MPIRDSCCIVRLISLQRFPVGAHVERLLILLICMSIAMLITAWVSIVMVLA